MLNDKLMSGRAIMRALLPSEETVDASIVESAKLVISIVEARRDTGVAVEVGHKAFLRATAGLAALSEARDHIVCCHRELTETRDAFGLPPRSLGCTLGKPKVFTEASAERVLKAVDAA